MTYHLRKAVASNAKPLIGLYSESGCGKTHSALMLAKGFVGDMSRVMMIETESGRGEAWADDATVGGYNVLTIREDFSPKNYGEAISVAEKADMQCLIIDSASHEWEGVGGVLSMAADNEAAGKKGPLVWQRPKMDHAREFMLRLTQTPIPLVIVCMRAKYAMEQKIVNGKKDWARSTDLSPKQSDDILFEMFVHGWIDRDHVFHGTKYTLEKMRSILIDGERITVDTGKRIAAWASGGVAAKADTRLSLSEQEEAVEVQRQKELYIGVIGASAEFVTADQAIHIADVCKEAGIESARFFTKAGVQSFAMIPANRYQHSLDWIAQVVEYRKTKGQ